MNKKIWVVVGIFLILILLVLVGLKFTGYVTLEEINVGRIIEKSENITNVTISIDSPGNLLSIKETFSGENCSVIESSVNQEIDIFEFKYEENTWILGSLSNGISVELYYVIPSECEVVEGEYYVLDESNILLSGIISGGKIGWCDGADIDKSGKVDLNDYIIFKNNFNRKDCSPVNNWCDGADTDKSGKVDLTDFIKIRNNFGNTNCGSMKTAEEISWCDGADINRDGSVGIWDFIVLRNNFGRKDCSSENSWCEGADTDKNGGVDLTDYTTVRNNFGESDCDKTWTDPATITGSVISNFLPMKEGNRNIVILLIGVLGVLGLIIFRRRK